jgi:hypothetical protein
LAPTATAQLVGPLQITAAFRLMRLVVRAVEAHELVSWGKGTTEKLDELIGMSVSITGELKQINIAIKEGTTTAFSDFVEHTLKADIRQFEVNMSELENYKNQSDDSRHRIDLLTHQLEHDVFTSLDYGPATYETTYTGSVVMLALYKYTHIPREHQKESFARVAAQFGTWLEPSQDGSPAELEQNEQKKIEEIKKNISSTIETYKIPVSVPYTGVEVRIEIGGDLDKGFTVKKSTKIFGTKPPGIEMFTESLRNKVQAKLDDLRAEYSRRVKTEMDLESVLSQLELYHTSLLDVARGGRLALRDEDERQPKTHH